MQADPHLLRAFGSASPIHYAWQTECPVVSEHERDLVQSAFAPPQGRLLDLGCAEGATLKHLGEPSSAFGIDIFHDKLRFARAHVRAEFAAASAEALPFRAGVFDHVIVRDVVHHVPDPRALIDECRRVLAPGGRLDVLEPCRYNPLIAVHALMNRAERGELRSTPRFLERLVETQFEVISIGRHQPLPVHRLVFHPDIGRPAWARGGAVRRVVDAVERGARLCIPPLAWAYVHVRGRARP
jgi:SAM-dependent methyltransferase